MTNPVRLVQLLGFFAYEETRSAQWKTRTRLQIRAEHVDRSWPKFLLALSQNPDLEPAAVVRWLSSPPVPKPAETA